MEYEIGVIRFVGAFHEFAKMYSLDRFILRSQEPRVFYYCYNKEKLEKRYPHKSSFGLFRYAMVKFRELPEHKKIVYQQIKEMHDVCIDLYRGRVEQRFGEIKKVLENRNHCLDVLI